MQGMRVYCGKVAWGWKMYGIGYRAKWFLGFSIAQDSSKDWKVRNGN